MYTNGLVLTLSLDSHAQVAPQSLANVASLLHTEAVGPCWPVLETIVPESTQRGHELVFGILPQIREWLPVSDKPWMVLRVKRPLPDDQTSQSRANRLREKLCFALYSQASFPEFWACTLLFIYFGIQVIALSLQVQLWQLSEADSLISSPMT